MVPGLTRFIGLLCRPDSGFKLVLSNPVQSLLNFRPSKYAIGVVKTVVLDAKGWHFFSPRLYANNKEV